MSRQEPLTCEWQQRHHRDSHNEQLGSLRHCFVCLPIVGEAGPFVCGCDFVVNDGIFRATRCSARVYTKQHMGGANRHLHVCSTVCHIILDCVPFKSFPHWIGTIEYVVWGMNLQLQHRSFYDVRVTQVQTDGREQLANGERRHL